MQKLSGRKLLLIGFTLFSMFFGAGNLIFPPDLGAKAGIHFWPAFLGLAISAVGLPIAGVVAVARAQGLEKLAGRVHPVFAQVFMILIYLSIGPCLAIPRTASTSFAMLAPLVGTGAGLQLGYSVVFFAAAFLVALQPEDARPADAGAVIEKQYPQGSGEKYIPCGAGSIKNNTRQTAADIAAEIQAPLPFGVEKDSPDPQILIMHTHATEDYRLSAGLWFTPGDGARSTDRSINMCAVGRVVADTLNAAGIHTLHDETLNDYPSYTGSYANSRAVVQQYLAQYPSIKVVLDVHRDAIETENGSRMAPVCTVDGRQAAQVMIICGCDNGTTVQLPDWRQNLRVAAAWERAMEGMYPGFTRPVLFSYRFYNQDLTTGSLLIEIGGHGNNLNEALYAGQLAAKGLAAALLGGA